MMVASEADEAWWPPTFSASVFSRRWLAWWMVQLASHSTLRSSSPRITRSSCEIISLIAGGPTVDRFVHHDGKDGALASLEPCIDRDADGNTITLILRLSQFDSSLLQYPTDRRGLPSSGASCATVSRSQFSSPACGWPCLPERCICAVCAALVIPVSPAI